ncbi:MAG: ABC transporter permease [Anaerobutyricum soehngenii]
MRMFKVELKRILSSRRTLIILGIGLLMSIVMGILPITYETINYTDANGTVISLQGKKAIEYKKSIRSKYDGEVTGEKLKSALTAYQKVIKENGNITEDNEKFPLTVYTESISPIKPLLSKMPEVFADPQTGVGSELKDIPIEESDDFYNKAKSHLKDVISLEYDGNKKIIDTASEMYEKVKTPFSLYGGFSRDAFDYITLNVLILLILCVAITAPTFAEGYQNGSDNILRCTKFGRIPFVAYKILALFFIIAIYYLLCMSIQIGILNYNFGTECLNTSIQMLFSAVGLLSWDLGQLQIAVVLGGLLSVLSTVALTLFISAKVKTSLTAILISIVTALLPTIIYVAAGVSWLAYILPSAGIGMQNSLLYQLVDINFLSIGSSGVWTPHIIVGVAIVELIIFTAFSIYSYCRHRVD